MFHIFITLQMPLSGANSTKYLTIAYLIVFHYGFLYMHTPGFSYVCHTVYIKLSCLAFLKKLLNIPILY